VLKLAWAQKYRNRLSIDSKVTITALNSSKGEDGDTHGGSRVNGVGLPMVAEILNGHAGPQKAARDELKPGAEPEKNLYGAWRLWFEHPPHDGVQCQTFGKNPPPICSNQTMGGAESNPAHSFEIHPVFAVNDKAVGRSSLVLTADNQSVKKTEAAIAHYTGPNKVLTVVRSSTALTLTSISVSHNYASLKIRVTKARTETRRAKDGAVDGGFVLADVLASEDEAQVLKAGVRMFYFRDSAPGDVLETAVVGNEFIVLGMPRINMDDVLKRTATQATVSMPLPFEFVVVALIQVLQRPAPDL
jgi:hypothetical protein